MNIDPLIKKIQMTVTERAIPGLPGAYARFADGPAEPNAYGCADAANILYTIGSFERCLEKRAACIAVLRDMQSPDTGLFQEDTHHMYHTTAHCVAALELFDAAPFYPLSALSKYLNPTAMSEFLASLDWFGQPWSQSHKGAGVFAALVLTGEANILWQREYFAWLDTHCDPEFGIGLSGAVQAAQTDPARHLFGWFHYLFNYLYAKRAFPYPERLIDTCLKLYRERAFPEHFGNCLSFMEIDWIFALNRATRQIGYRFAEGRAALREFTREYIPTIQRIYENSGFQDLHTLFGTVTALAELQAALPGELESTIPLKNVLDRRPFI